MDLDLMKRLALAITEQFGENSEVVVHDLRSADPDHTIVRFVTSWATPESAIDQFLKDLAACK